MQDKQQLIASWTRNLDHNAEQQLHAQGMLDEAILPDTAELAVASERMGSLASAIRRKGFIC